VFEIFALRKLMGYGDIEVLYTLILENFKG